MIFSDRNDVDRTVNVYQGNETLVTKTTVTVPINGGPVEAVSTIETVPYWTRSRRKTGRFPFFSVRFGFCICFKTQSKVVTLVLPPFSRHGVGF